MLENIYYQRQFVEYLVIEKLNLLFKRILDPRFGQIYDYTILYFIALH